VSSLMNALSGIKSRTSRLAFSHSDNKSQSFGRS
jgi:hypothetical protein